MKKIAEINKVESQPKFANSFWGTSKTSSTPVFIQPKLTINNPIDEYEKEADEMADKVMRMEQPFVQAKSLPINSIPRKCAHCEEEERKLQRKEMNGNVATADHTLESYVGNLNGSGQTLSNEVRNFYEPRFGYDFRNVKVHTDSVAAKSAQSINALAYTSGENIVFNQGQYSPNTESGKKLLGHELTHVVQQLGIPSNAIQLRAAPYIKKITVHLAPPQSADLEWEGTPPASATGRDHFTVSTGKGYGEPDDPPGTCRRQCCTDPDTQCAPPWNQPTSVGSCCTYYGNTFWTGTPEAVHGGPGGWRWWTPIQPYYSSRSIALHQHTEVTGQPIGHGCVRMDDENAQRIHDFSNGRRTNVTIDGRAAPVLCENDRRCNTGATGLMEDLFLDYSAVAANEQEPVEGLEGLLS